MDSVGSPPATEPGETAADAARPDGEAPARRPGPGLRRRLHQEIALVVAVAVGGSAVSAIISLTASLTAHRSLASQTAVLVGPASPRPLVDLAYQLLGVATGLLPALLAVFLLARDGRRIPGLDLRRPGSDACRGLGVAVVIGGAGLGLYLAAHAAGLALTVVPEDLPPTWYRIPLLVLQAAQNGVLEEVVVLGYLLVRLADLRWGTVRAAMASAVVRGSYHLYQGFGAFVGNVIMGLIFATLYRRWGRVMPLLVAHTLLDVGAFVGYALLAGKVSWIPTPR
jgi:hypothetical protein